MKKFARLLALILALVMCFGITAYAVTDRTENDLAEITDVATGATVVFASDEEDEEKINVTYTNTDAIKEGEYYLVMVIDYAEGGEDYTPNKNSILYIDQTTGDANGSISFQVYASKLTDSAIAIYGMDEKLIAAIIKSKESALLLGDVDRNGVVNVGDATLLLRFLATLETEDKLDMKAANVDGNSAVNVGDATKLLRFLAKLDTLG